MLRYLKEAFWARPELGGLGRIPWNVLAMAGVAILGFGAPAIWLAGLGLETLYLYALATNPRFQRWVDAVDLAKLKSTDETARTNLVEGLAAPSQDRVTALEQKIGRIEDLYRESQADEFLFDSNREALHKLMSIYIHLLVAQRNIGTVGAGANQKELQLRIDAMRKELAAPDLAPALRESKQATLNVLLQRLNTIQKCNESLAEIDSDLTRIEAQIDLALEEASLKGKPTAISGNIDLVSHLLVDDTSMTTTSSGSVLEN
ncbi:MAG TPA: hypothetical protein VH087_07985 [Thermoanaerobaculia bacterium]|nr:hypothetical protein [Thermoanaerobaculia bacterium]